MTTGRALQDLRRRGDAVSGARAWGGNCGCALPGAELAAWLLLRARPGGGGGTNNHSNRHKMSLEQEEEAQPGRLLGGSDAGAYFIEPNVRFWINERQVQPGPGAAGGGEGAGRAAWNRAGLGDLGQATWSPPASVSWSRSYAANSHHPLDPLRPREGTQGKPNLPDAHGHKVTLQIALSKGRTPHSLLPELWLSSRLGRNRPSYLGRLSHSVRPPRLWEATFGQEISRTHLPAAEALQQPEMDIHGDFMQLIPGAPWQTLEFKQASECPKITKPDIQLNFASLSLKSTVHPDSSNLIPNLFRPAAFLPFMAPAVYLYAYLTAFSIINGNRSYTCHPLERSFLTVGAFASSSFFGVGQISGMNVLASRSLETTKGIAVMDKEGHVLGHSTIAGKKLPLFFRGKGIPSRGNCMSVTVTRSRAEV
ncbi:hypothetical protein P7K49_024523 [Saguinus oedipus]|uniref:Uncharacterized protein n=1 Tax=Saguinus oedipus TaxID=9490 RepID=A0ABQ9UPT8_SAGOE|nr:hypothetical protein P7K49_024523 [Saguinus oedipus]